MIHTRFIGAGLLLATLSACGGGNDASPGSGGTSTAPQPTVNQTSGGIWRTQFTVPLGYSSLSNTGDTIDATALITEQGDFLTLEKNLSSGCALIGFGQVSTTGGAVSASADWLITGFVTGAYSCATRDGVRNGTAVLTGAVAQRSTLTLTETDTSGLGLVGPATTSTWTYDSLYELKPSFALIAGNYVENSNTLSISGSGAIFEQDPASGCVINGQLAIPNASYNAYSFTLTYSNCTGDYAIYNGTSAMGLAYYDHTVSPNRLEIFWHGVIPGGPYAVIGDFPKL